MAVARDEDADVSARASALGAVNGSVASSCVFTRAGAGGNLLDFFNFWYLTSPALSSLRASMHFSSAFGF